MQAGTNFVITCRQGNAPLLDHWCKMFHCVCMPLASASLRGCEFMQLCCGALCTRESGIENKTNHPNPDSITRSPCAGVLSGAYYLYTGTGVEEAGQSSNVSPKQRRVSATSKGLWRNSKPGSRARRGSKQPSS